VCGARGSEAQRAEAAARHQGRSTPGRDNNWGLNSGGLSISYYNTGGLSQMLSSLPIFLPVLHAMRVLCSVLCF